ncbi:hypothetical protein ACFYTC_18970 [Actinomadura nitritigenes]
MLSRLVRNECGHSYRAHAEHARLSVRAEGLKPARMEAWQLSFDP